LTSFALWASRAVTPSGVRERVRIWGEGGRIAAVEPDSEAHDGDVLYPGALLLPGLVDLQVNGGAGAGYDDPDAAARARATRYHVERGTTSLLATLVSAPLPALEQQLGALAQDVSEDGPVLGIHLEGPFLAVEKAGAHEAGVLCDPTPEAVHALLRAGRGALRLTTLAPERAGALAAVAAFTAAGVRVAAGHTRASSEQLAHAIDAGLDLVTHVGNASDWPGRVYDAERGYRRSEPGVAGRFLFDERLRGTLILDGRHLDLGLARALVRLRGTEAVALVSDATAAAGLPPGRHRVLGGDVEVHAAGHATRGEGLAGSTITLLDAVRIAVQQAGIPLVPAVAMASRTPARWLGLDARKGALAPERDADLLLVGPRFELLDVYRAGARVSPAVG